MTEFRHRRDDEDRSFQHERMERIPEWVRSIVYAVKEIGIPACVIGALFFYNHTTGNKLADALDRQANTLEALVITVNSNHSEAKEWREHFMAEFRGSRK